MQTNKEHGAMLNEVTAVAVIPCQTPSCAEVMRQTVLVSLRMAFLKLLRRLGSVCASGPESDWI